MDKKIASFLFFILSSTLLMAQMTSRSLGMGGVATVLNDQNSLFLNPAGLAAVKTLGVMATTEQFYFIEGIHRSGAGVIVPVGTGAFGAGFSTFGFSEFRQQEIGLSYARKLMDKLQLGARFHYFQTRIPEYGNAGNVSFSLGLQAQLISDLLVGVFISNPQQDEIDSGAQLPTRFSTGLSYLLSKKITTVFELEKDVDLPVRFRFGFDYNLTEKLSLRMGYSSEPSNFHLGIGLQLSKALQLDLGNRYDPTLGLTPGLSVSHIFE